MPDSGLKKCSAKTCKRDGIIFTTRSRSASQPLKLQCIDFRRQNFAVTLVQIDGSRSISSPFENLRMMKLMSKNGFCTGRSIRRNQKRVVQLRCRKVSQRMKASGFPSRSLCSTGGAAKVRFSPILQTGSVDFWCPAKTPEIHRTLGHVGMIHDCLQWILEVVGIVSDVHQALLLCHKISF